VSVKAWGSRERVFTALNHREPDRVPINFGGCAQTTILECAPEAPGATNLYRHLGVEPKEPFVLSALANQVYNMDPAIMDRFGSDFRLIMPNSGDTFYAPTNVPVLEYPVGTGAIVYPNGSKTLLGCSCGLHVKKLGLYVDVCERPLEHAETIADIENYPYWPTEADIRHMADGKLEEIRRIKKESGKVVLEDTYKAYPHLMYSLLCGMEKWMIDMKTEDMFFRALSDKLFEVGMMLIEYWIKPIGKEIDIVSTYDDMGMQNGLLISRDDYREHLKPYEREMILALRKHTDAKIYRHSCGSVYDVIGDFIDIGVDILNPIQPLAKNMEPWRLKKEFGKDITFFGGIDTQELLYKDPKTIRAGVKETLEIMGKGGGYIFATSHNVEPDTPPENVVAMFDAALEFGKY